MANLPVVLSYIQAEKLLQARQQNMQIFEVTPDLGLTTSMTELSSEGVRFPTGEQISWASLATLAANHNACFLLEEGLARPIQTFSEITNRQCSLYPTQGAPSMLIAGFVMHRFKEIDPVQSAALMLKTVAPVVGRVLDTATGLGYTAIASARTADEVITIELDPGAQAIARLNPWSRELFQNPKIQQMIGDAAEVVPDFETGYFTRILHDPPAFSLAGDLYSGAFYRELYRVLKPGGRLFHYIGDLESRSGSTVTRGALKRLQEAGFKRVIRRPEAFGVLCYK